MLILPEFTLKINDNSFFKMGFDWKNIPPFAVITGKNGSGKTLLLEEIRKHLSKNGKVNFFYISSGENSNILSKAFNRNQKEHEENSIVSSLKGWRDNWKINPSKRVDAENHRHYVFVGLIERKLCKELNYLNDTEISNAVLDTRFEALYENINNLQIENSFVRFFEKSLYITNELSDLDLTLNERKKRISDKLSESFGTDIPPWEIINNKFSEYGFKHKISEPKTIGQYHTKFLSENGDEILFGQLSSGEKVIVQLVLWSYDTQDDLKIGNHNKLLIIDEFDAHLNPSMAKMFIDIVKTVLIEQFGMQVIITTHSPSTVAYCEDDSVFWMENGKIFSKDKEEIIESLTPGILTFRKDTLILLTDKNYIIFTEGETDISYIKTAAEKLNFQEIIDKCAFIPADGDKGKDWLNAFKNSNSIKKIMAIFDFDKKGIEGYNDTVRHGKKVPKTRNGKTDIYSYKDDYIYSILIPCNRTDYPNESSYGYHPIEFLFNNRDLIEYKSDAIIDEIKNQCINDMYFIEPDRSINTVKLNFSKENKDKEKFALYVEEHKDRIDFQNFLPLLRKIKHLFDL